MIFGVVLLHVLALHITGSNNPDGIDVKGPQDTVPFHPYFTYKDMVGLGVFLIVYSVFVFYAPNFMGHPDNYIEANPLSTPAHIVPEWYFLPFYAILRAFGDDWWLMRWFVGWFMEAKLAGVLAMFGSLLVLAVLPWLDTSKVRSCRYRPIYKWFTVVLVLDFLVLGYCGAMPAAEPYVTISRWATLYYFAHFLVLTPLLGWFETPKQMPSSIHAATLKGSAPVAAGAAAKMEKP